MDGDSSWLLIVVFLLLVCCGGYFGGSESAFSAMNKIRMKSRAEDGDKKAKKAIYISNNFEKAITTLLIGNNITHIAASSVATIFALRLFRSGTFGSASEETVTVVCTVITTLIVFLFSEMIPKALANDLSNSFALVSAPFLRMLMKIFSPLVTFFTLISSSVSKLFKAEEMPSVTEEELYDIIETIEEEGVMDEEQSDLFKSALEFSDTTAADIMTVRDDIVALNSRMTNAEIAKTIVSCGYSRLPVYSGSFDNMLGTLRICSFLKEYAKNPKVDVRKLLTPPFYVRGDVKIDELLTTMRLKKLYFAFVTGEGGRIIGILTIEDILEELVGEIWDETDVVDPDFVKLGGNRFMVSTKLKVGDAFGRLGLSCRDKTMAAKTLCDWVKENFDHVPKEDESFTYENLEVSVSELEEGEVSGIVIKLDNSPVRTAAESAPAQLRRKESV